MKLSTQQLGSLQMVAAMAISGTIGAFVFESGQSPFNVVFFRCLFGALCLAAWCAATGLLRRRHFTRRMLGLSALGGVFIVFNWVLLFAAFHHASISIATAVYNTQPFMLVGLGVLLLGERVDAAKLAWIALAFVGLLLLVGIGPLSQGSASLLGFAMALGAALLYAFAALVIKRLAGVPPQLIALVQVSLGTLLLLPLADFGALPAPQQSPAPWLWLLGMGVLHTGLMYILLYSAIQRLPTTRVAVLSFIYPAIALAIDHGFYGQQLGLQQWLGVALIALGNLGVNLGLGWRRAQLSG
ncbi:DMT family transporter [Paucibacter sp. XJ19-41]|uniref:DMT family transporter n=1 Tax=Paucibacter sp. XJ19-41 TaxID=2927824 RepID=UPI0010F73649|nr:DMT family transporter [Paucibacter sp. XJ19-41]MDC6171130.1 DMT family transporter [Paucibacter sp. XJ19-41]